MALFYSVRCKEKLKTIEIVHYFTHLGVELFLTVQIDTAHGKISFLYTLK